MARRPLTEVFADAADGIWHAIVAQPNFRIQLVIAALAIVGALVLDFNITQWAIVLLTIGFVLAAELFNTCLEYVVDLIQPESHPLARAAKHAGAGAVLVASVTSAIVGLVLYGEALFRWFQTHG